MTFKFFLSRLLLLPELLDLVDQSFGAFRFLSQLHFPVLFLFRHLFFNLPNLGPNLLLFFPLACHELSRSRLFVLDHLLVLVPLVVPLLLLLFLPFLLLFYHLLLFFSRFALYFIYARPVQLLLTLLLLFEQRLELLCLFSFNQFLLLVQLFYLRLFQLSLFLDLLFSLPLFLLVFFLFLYPPRRKFFFVERARLSPITHLVHIQGFSQNYVRFFISHQLLLKTFVNVESASSITSPDTPTYATHTQSSIGSNAHFVYFHGGRIGHVLLHFVQHAILDATCDHLNVTLALFFLLFEELLGHFFTHLRSHECFLIVCGKFQRRGVNVEIFAAQVSIFAHFSINEHWRFLL